MKKLLTLCLFLLLATPCLAEMISVVHQPAELRDRPSVSGSKIIRQLPRYTPLEVLGKESDYFQVRDASGRKGYVHRSLIKQASTVSVTAEACNVRSGPGTEFAIIFKTTRGDSFQVLSKERDWVEILAETGQIGWIWQNLVWGY